MSEAIDQENILVPPLILRPFIENSIWHGIAKKEGTGKITVEIRKEEAIVVCTVEDDSIGRTTTMHKMPVSSGMKSLGMKITKEQIDILNKTKNTSASVHIRDLLQGTLVEVQLPLQENF